MDAVLAGAAATDGATTAKAIRLIEDPDGAVRWKVLGLLAHGSSQERATALPWLSVPLRDLMMWLLDGADRAEASPRLDDAESLDRLFAAARAVRVATKNPVPLEAAAAADPEVRSFAEDELAHRRRTRGSR
jgi:hypothetical protein